MNDTLTTSILAGIQAGAIDALKRARQFGTKLVISVNGQMAEVTADEAEAMLKESEAKKDGI